MLNKLIIVTVLLLFLWLFLIWWVNSLENMWREYDN